MHILFLPSWYPSSPDDIAGSFFREQAIALHQSGCRVGVIAPRLLSLRSKGAFALGRVSVENDQGVETFRDSLVNWLPRFWPVLGMRFANRVEKHFASYVHEHGLPDVIHVHAMLPAGFAGMRLAKKYNIPMVVSEHSSAYARGKVSALGLRGAGILSEFASARFAVGSRFATDLEHRLSQKQGYWSVMHNQVDHSFLETEMQPIGIGKYRIFHASSLDQNKNVMLLLQAFERGFGGDPKVELVIGGEGNQRACLEAFVISKGIQGQVKFLGRLTRKEISEQMMQADLFALSSTTETFGVVLVEALASGRPVVATDCGGPSDIVNAGNGYLVPVGDIDAYSAALKQAYQQRANFDPIVLRQECNERFGAAALVQKWRDIYQKVSKNHGADQ
nr:glycosyltransferase [Amylibacter marinus]